MGLGFGQRALRMIEMASRACPDEPVRYVGVDLFEMRTAADGPGVTLKMAHRLLKASGAKIQLLPGDPFSALARSANSLPKIDLVVVSSRWDAANLAPAWFYVPRLLHDDSRVFVETQQAEGKPSMRLVSPDEVRALAGSAMRRAA